MYNIKRICINIYIFGFRLTDYDKWKEKEEKPQYFTRSNKNGLYLGSG